MPWTEATYLISRLGTRPAYTGVPKTTRSPGPKALGVLRVWGRVKSKVSRGRPVWRASSLAIWVTTVLVVSVALH